MLGIVGTVPEEGVGILVGIPELLGDKIALSGMSFPINRGTMALVAAALKTAQHIGQDLPVVFLVGDTGKGDGSRLLYEYLSKNLTKYELDTLTFHYLLPDSDWHNRILFKIQELKKAPILIADAGYMYVAKMSGFAKEYHLFTPDVGELAFLADEEAPHPFYTRGFILHEEEKVPELVQRAYIHQNASRWMLIKGKIDYVVHEGSIVGYVEEPLVEALEPMGGTGDTITGMVSVMIDARMPTKHACLAALRANRIAGLLSNPTPATQVTEVIRKIPEALKEVI